MKIVATVEARMSSERLPGKSLRKILGKPMLELLIERVKSSTLIQDVVIATSSKKDNQPIEDLAKKLNVHCFRGSEDDVLDRVLNAAKSVQGELIVELWGDSPLIDPQMLDNMIEYYKENDFDCIGTTLPNFAKTYPVGFSAIIFPTKILKEVSKITHSPVDRENVSNYIYEHPEKYKIAAFPCPRELSHPEFRLTVDEENDFILIENIFQNLYPKNPKFTASDVIKFLLSNPTIAKINSNVTQRKLDSWKRFQQ